MPEKPGGVAEAPDAEEIKKQRVAELERGIQQKKQHLDVMVGDREKWGLYSRHVITLKEQLGRNEFDPGTEKKKQEELTKYQGELRKIEDECCEKYKVKSISALGTAISNCRMEIGRMEERVQILQGRPYVFGQQAGQSQQEQGDHIQQRVKTVAESQAEFTAGKGKNNETAESPDEKVQNQYTALKVTSFQSHRERFNQEHQENQEHKSKAHDEIGQGRPRGREM